jgi:hypothetical protein
MGVSGQHHAPVPIGQEAGWAPEPVWTQKIEEKSSSLCRGSNPDRTVVQPVVRLHTDWANTNSVREIRNTYNILVAELKGKHVFEEPVVSGRTLLKWTLQN